MPVSPVEARPSPIPFRTVNRVGTWGYDGGMQRHHLLPRQLLTVKSLQPMLMQLGREAIGFDDFRTNGLLLPCAEQASLKTGLPLHRGPHRHYNAAVIERAGAIERAWSLHRGKHPDDARHHAIASLRLLQNALRKRLLAERRRMILNRNDPIGTGFDFTELDAMAEAMWAAD